jgi:hypothetical protein
MKDRMTDDVLIDQWPLWCYKAESITLDVLTPEVPQYPLVTNIGTRIVTNVIRVAKMSAQSLHLLVLPSAFRACRETN